MILQNNQTDLVLVPAGQLKPLDTICGFQTVESTGMFHS